MTIALTSGIWYDTWQKEKIQLYDAQLILGEGEGVPRLAQSATSVAR